ncbi:TIGR02996 domain-containing protein [Pyxidicoccus xibeiensis]|uniref:TIGR02996 domain-containing protein n=1 Tax=Pyxidicoccus xibeiensis TaxID=2906759 RepID=UPI0020A75CA4|nr:TIGR02996 domain-containing protein [Pyxidicoccus xibeiensis]MCP3135879.1 TIGR02996 domain-containing protein [Pyxidicoccus xibeiensis]
MSTYEDLLERIAAEPASNAARLVCADVLAESDAERAELIHAQVSLSERVNPARRQELKRRVEVLLHTRGPGWLEPLLDAQAREPRFQRGFVEELDITEEQLAAHGQALFAREPLYRLSVRTRDGRGLTLAAAQPWFSRVRWLRLEGKGLAAEVKALASSPQVAKLEGMALDGAGTEALQALAGAKALTGLRSLNLSSTDLSDDAVAVLASGTLPLERLYLSGTGLSDEGAQALSKAKGLSTLKVLALNRNALSDEGAQALAKSKGLNALEWLELSRNELSEEGALAFRSAKALPGLKRLELQGMGLDDDTLGPLRKRLGAGLRL